MSIYNVFDCNSPQMNSITKKSLCLVADRAKFFTPAHGIQITIMVFVMSVAVLIDIISYVLLTNGVPRERLNGTLEWIFGDCVQIAIMMAIVNITRTELVFLAPLVYHVGIIILYFLSRRA